MVRELLTGALRGVSHPNTDLDAQLFLLRVRQLRAAAGADPAFAVAYRAQVSAAELADPQVLIWDIGRSYDAGLGNFDHHQDHALGATPIILLQALGLAPSPLDRYVDLGDRGHFLKHPQPHPYVETLHGLAPGIDLLRPADDARSVYYQDLLTWVEESGSDPFGRFTEAVLPERFHPFLAARRAEEAAARAVASMARWFGARVGKVAYVESGSWSVMQALYTQGAAVVITHEPQGRMSGWTAAAARYTVGANPALVAVPDQLDLRPLFAILSGLEPTGHAWGGQAGVGGSPREEGGSALSADQVIGAVRSYLA